MKGKEEEGDRDRDAAGWAWGGPGEALQALQRQCLDARSVVAAVPGARLTRVSPLTSTW